MVKLHRVVHKQEAVEFFWAFQDPDEALTLEEISRRYYAKHDYHPHPRAIERILTMDSEYLVTTPQGIRQGPLLELVEQGHQARYRLTGFYQELLRLVTTSNAFSSDPLCIVAPVLNNPDEVLSLQEISARLQSKYPHFHPDCLTPKSLEETLTRYSDRILEQVARGPPELYRLTERNRELFEKFYKPHQ